MHDYKVENPRDALQNEIDLIRGEYPDAAERIWLIFRQLKTPDRIEIKDDAKEKELELKVKELEDQLVKEKKRIEELQEQLKDEEKEEVIYEDDTRNINFNFKVDNLIWVAMVVFIIYKVFYDK